MIALGPTLFCCLSRHIGNPLCCIAIGGSERHDDVAVVDDRIMWPVCLHDVLEALDDNHRLDAIARHNPEIRGEEAQAAEGWEFIDEVKEFVAFLTAARIRVQFHRQGLIATALADPLVVEVMANPDGKIWIDRIGEGRKATKAIITANDANTILRLLADHAGVIVNADTPLVSATLPETGERFQGLFPPIVARPSFAIRKRPAVIFPLSHYVDTGIMSAAIARSLRQALKDRLNIIVIGGTGSGKTTLTNALLAEPAIIDDRVIIIEDTAELQCVAHDCLSMLTKTIAPVVTMGDLARATLRLRPDRIIVGEVRDGSILEMIKLWNTGHPGGIATLHANSPLEALYRVEDLVGEVTERIPFRQIAMTINLIVEIRRAPGSPAGRVVDRLVYVNGHEGGEYVLSEVTPANAVHLERKIA